MIEFKRGIRQRAAEEGGERRSDPANEHPLRLDPGDNEPTDQHIVPGLHSQPRGDIEECVLW